MMRFLCLILFVEKLITWIGVISIMQKVINLLLQREHMDTHMVVLHPKKLLYRNSEYTKVVKN